MSIKTEIKNVSRHISINGYEFDVLSDKWSLDRNRTIHLDFLNSLATDDSDSVLFC